jgi:hypothetical protein
MHVLALLALHISQMLPFDLVADNALAAGTNKLGTGIPCFTGIPVLHANQT